jgi:hypothetical protein
MKKDAVTGSHTNNVAKEPEQQTLAYRLASACTKHSEPCMHRTVRCCKPTAYYPNSWKTPVENVETCEIESGPLL